MGRTVTSVIHNNIDLVTRCLSVLSVKKILGSSSTVTCRSNNVILAQVRKANSMAGLIRRSFFQLQFLLLHYSGNSTRRLLDLTWNMQCCLVAITSQTLQAVTRCSKTSNEEGRRVFNHPYTSRLKAGTHSGKTHPDRNGKEKNVLFSQNISSYS